MTKARTESQFIDQITEDRTWRMREISDLRSATKGAKHSLQRALLRAITAICYAHWEGYVKFSAGKMMEYISLRRLKISELNSQFLANKFLPKLEALSRSGVGIDAGCELIAEILSCSEQRFSRLNPDLINTRSNLSHSVLSDICTVCCVPKDDFDDKKIFIDKMLLGRRNSIAHGEEVYVSIDDLDNLVNDTFFIMRAFGSALENIVVLRTYQS